MRDVRTAVGVFQVRAAGLRTEFPPLRALDTTPGNLRPATTSLIGRESEVAELQGVVKAHRLVTFLFTDIEGRPVGGKQTRAR